MGFQICMTGGVLVVVFFTLIACTPQKDLDKNNISFLVGVPAWVGILAIIIGALMWIWGY